MLAAFVLLASGPSCLHPDPHHLHFSTCITARFRSQADADANAPVDLFNVWMFNITNVDEVRAGGLPKLVSATA